jgi:hypothetical protein
MASTQQQLPSWRSALSLPLRIKLGYRRVRTGLKTRHYKERPKGLDLKLTLTFSMQEWDVANPNLEEAMNRKEQFAGMFKKSVAGGAMLAMLIAATATTAVPSSDKIAQAANTEKQMNTTQSKFYCNIKALTPEERAHHKQLGDKLMAARKKIVEMDKGYEFQFSPKDITLAELADWVVNESKCCPFFDFHIDLENEGKLVCLRLTGEEGIKQFARAEFAVQ